MASYYVSKDAQANGDHEVHEASCRYIPNDKKYLGDYTSCSPAVTEAKKTYSQSNGCKTCSTACHTS